MSKSSKRYWLMKTEPDSYSIENLERDGKTFWEGVRNYQARNSLRDDFKVGDEVLIYHSSTEPMGVAGLARVCKAAYPDHFAFDKKSQYFDPKSKTENPTWFMVDVEFVAKFPTVVPLSELKQARELEGMVLLQRGSRLSIQPVSAEQFAFIKKLGSKK